MDKQQAGRAEVWELTDSPTDRIELEVYYPGILPDKLFRYWTEAVLLTKWWPQEAELDVREGGSYHLSWPKMEWSLRGSYTCVRPGKMLAFTWRWDHEPDTPTRVVSIDFQPAEEGSTRLHLTHGYYREHILKDGEERTGHIEGWHYFLGKLQEVSSFSPSSSTLL